MHPLKRHSSLWVSLVLLLILMAHPTQSPAEQGDMIRLKWAFGALTGPENKAQLLSIEQNAVLHTGDRIKIFLQPQTDCHLYLFYRSSQNKLLVLLPAEGSGSRSTAGIQHMVPAGSRWFQLDDVTGIETFYLLASARPLENLDTLCRSLSAAGSVPDRSAVGSQILSEISRLQRKHRTLTAAAERPVRLGGNFRGTAEGAEADLPDISRIAVEISASNFYSRTFTIDHR